MIERSAALGKIVAERLAPGVYFLSAATAEEAAAALAAAGLEAPPLAHAAGPPPASAGPRPGRAPADGVRRRSRRRPAPGSTRCAISSTSGGRVLRGRAAARLDPGAEARRAARLPRGLLRGARRSAARSPTASSGRLVLTERQIAQSDPHPERLEAGGLDYLGKVRVVERALRASGDRLEVLYRLPGAEPVRALLRPVRLDKNEKGLSPRGRRPRHGRPRTRTPRRRQHGAEAARILIRRRSMKNQNQQERQGHQDQLKLAVLVDADNTQASIVEGLLAEIAKYGVASVKRIYGDWTSTNLRSWKDKLLEFAIQPVQQFSYTTGKNSTDSAMIIDAMDLLYTENLDGFCIVSSDSDFTRIADAAPRGRQDGPRLRPAQDAQALRRRLRQVHLHGDPARARGRARGPRRPRGSAQGAADIKLDRKAANLMRAAVEDAADEFGFAYLGSVGTYIMNRQPEFDPRNYGYRKLGDLIKASGLFDIDERASPTDQGKQIYIKTRAKGR